MSKNRGCFFWIGHISWFIIWFIFSIALFSQYAESEEQFDLKENIIILLIWMIPLFIIILFNFQHNFLKYSYYSVYIVFSLGIIYDEVMSISMKSVIWTLISAPIILLFYRNWSKRKNNKKEIESKKLHLKRKREKLKRNLQEIKLKQILESDRLRVEELNKEIERKKFENEFIKKLSKIHQDSMYDFSKIKYINKQTKILVTCKSHGDFYIKPIKLAKGMGCPKCSLLNGSKYKDFINSLEKFTENSSNFTNKNSNKNDNDHLLEIIDKLSDLKKGQEIIKSDTTKILAKTNKMISKIKDIKSLTKKTNESVENSISKITELIEKNYDFNSIEEYIPIVKKWFKFWDRIEENTKTYMPGSEWLFENLKNAKANDFSPFVLYYCRALENELLNKIFISFHDHINKTNKKDFDNLFNWDRVNLSEKKLKEYELFFNFLKNNIQKNRKKYTLGEMRLILNLLPNSKNKKGSSRFNRSPLLKKLSEYISDKIGGFEAETIKQLENLINNYRNKSAHVDEIKEKEALIFYKDFKVLMNKLIGKFEDV